MPEYLVDQILPHQEVHLIGGPSGSGKSTWALQTLVTEWQRGLDVLGHRSHPVPWVYVSGDRSYDSVLRTLARLHIKPDHLRTYSAVDHQVFDLAVVLRECRKLDPTPQLILCEGIASLMPKDASPNGYRDVAEYLTTLTAICKTTDTTVIGVTHSPKMREDSQYLNPRQRIMGSAAWAAYSETIIMIEPLKGDDPEASPVRRLYLLPRNSRERYIDMLFTEDGRMIEVDLELGNAMFAAWLGKLAAGHGFRTEDAQAGLASQLSRATVTRQLERAVEDGRLVHVCRGTYRVNARM